MSRFTQPKIAALSHRTLFSSLRGLCSSLFSFNFGVDRIFTTYLHGIFDDDRFRRQFLNRIRRDRGMEELSDVTAHYGTEEALNRLADHVRSRIDLNAVYARMGLKRGGK